MLTLDIAVATHRADGIERCAGMLMAPMEGVRYVISWQRHGGLPVPEALKRPDVEVLRYDGEGQSGNRNNAVAHCTADIILHSDDDLKYFPEGINGLRKAFAERPEMDVATFRTVHGPEERFPQSETRLGTRWPKGYFVAMFEIAFRRTTAGNMRCCDELGLGSPRFHGGEDEMFLYSAIKRGLDCRYVPVKVCAHPHVSTGLKANLSDENLRAAGLITALMFPLTAVLRVPLKAWRIARAGRAPLWRSLIRGFEGAVAAPGVLRRNHDTLW